MTAAETKIHQQRAAARRLWSPPDADGLMPFWTMQQLWELAATLPVKKLRVADLAKELDEVRWFSEDHGKSPTCRAVTEQRATFSPSNFRIPLFSTRRAK
jgi:hypothetical protein